MLSAAAILSPTQCKKWIQLTVSLICGKWGNGSLRRGSWSSTLRGSCRTETCIDVRRRELMSFTRRAFVIMPFGKKKAADQRVIDFDAVYHEFLAPAITAAGMAPH